MSVTVHVADVVLPVVDVAGRPVDPLAPGAVAVAGERVVAVGPVTEVVAAARRAGGDAQPRRRTWSGVLTPGLVNAHTHLQYTSFAELGAAGLPFARWMAQLMRRRATTTDREWAESARTGVYLAIRSGTTTVADVVTDAAALLPVARSRVGGVSYVEAVAADDRRWAGGERDRVIAALDAAPPGRVTALMPHSLYTLSRHAAAECAALARARGCRLHLHLAETAEETEFVALGTGRFADQARRAGWDLGLVRDGGCGRTPVGLADRLGLLGPDLHVAHGVHCDAADRALLRQRGVPVALCVRSNRVLHAGRPPVAAYLAEGSPLALGTDSLASSPSLDLLEEARAARDLARAQGYVEPDLSARLVRAATYGGARALGLHDVAAAGAHGAVGGLYPGARADLAVFEVPVADDPYDALVEHGAGRCRGTVLRGTLVHRR